MSYFSMQGEDRFQIGDVISVTEHKRLSLWRWLKEMWRLRSFRASRYELVTTDHKVTAITSGLAHTLKLPPDWSDWD